MKKIIYIVVFFAALPQAIFSASLEELVGSGSAGMLRAVSEPITLVQQKDTAVKLLPLHTELKNLVNNVHSNLDPNIMVEALSIYNKPKSAEEWSYAEQIAVFNQLIALSTLSGIQYYSESRKSMRVFYESSYVTDNSSSKKMLPDPSVTMLPKSLSLFARQKDLTFGDNAYSYRFQTHDDAIFIIQENLTPLTAGIIPVAGKNKLCTVMAVIDTGDCLLIYAASMVKTVLVPGMGERIGNSFTNRAVAVLKWFSSRANRVFG